MNIHIFKCDKCDSVFKLNLGKTKDGYSSLAEKFRGNPEGLKSATMESDGEEANEFGEKLFKHEIDRKCNGQISFKGTTIAC